MAYTIIVNSDNTLYGSCKERIMQREKLFNKLWFLVAPHYNGHDMSKCTVTMRYLLPISKEFVTETLVLSEEKYEDHLKYVLPIDTNLTKEWGGINLNLTFTMLDIDDNGNIVQRVRKTDDYILNITQLPNWDAIIPDSALSALDQRIIKQDAQIRAQDAQIRALADLANSIESSKVDNLVYDDKEETLQLSAKGVGIGDKVSVRDMLEDGIPVVDLESNNVDKPNENKPDSDNNHENGCNCGCEDNVVEFGYLQNGNGSFSEPTNEDNVIEF